MSDNEYLKLAIDYSRQSLDEGNFPAGAVVVRNHKIVSHAKNTCYPNLFHPDSKATIEAFEKLGLLPNSTLYISLQSCLMCSTIAYQAGIRRIVFAVPISKVTNDYYLTEDDSKVVEL